MLQLDQWLCFVFLVKNRPNNNIIIIINNNVIHTVTGDSFCLNMSGNNINFSFGSIKDFSKELK